LVKILQGSVVTQTMIGGLSIHLYKYPTVHMCQKLRKLVDSTIVDDVIAIKGGAVFGPLDIVCSSLQCLSQLCFAYTSLSVSLFVIVRLLCRWPATSLYLCTVLDRLIL